MALIYAQEIHLSHAKGGVLVCYKSGDDIVQVFIPRSAFYVALQESKNLVAELEAEVSDVVDIRA